MECDTFEDQENDTSVAIDLVYCMTLENNNNHTKKYLEQ